MPADLSPHTTPSTPDLPAPAYEAPLLRELGMLEDLTLGGTGTDPDGMFAMDNSISPT